MTDNDSTRALRRALNGLTPKLAAGLTAGLTTLALWCPAAAFAKPPVDSQSALIAHGDYIVHRVGMCIDCHTPKDAHGMPIASEDLHGADLPITPEPPAPPGWVSRSVKIAGLPAGYTEAQLITFLETGHTPSGGTAHPPMPDYRLNEHDARAVAAYLHSIN
ncbi:c-type cytochrome [Paraburkholderia rhizosphaerae]|uniref:Cytochrome c domain-containing protein n=1 Tax=Paraburkholderia rhizosphaerae TaxID=480658 RepID=A0A4R8M1V0_9BURK|nr:c-type cytochrome [Paraburkholderia rhizosphaerae]TDY53419.1 hypothetical protein BX592_103231 [Paraburkholderia rhizosphaerae]